MAEHEDFVLRISSAQKLNDFNRIVDHALQRERRLNDLRVVGAVAFAGTALIPLHDREVIFPAVLKEPARRHLRRSRASVNHEQHRIAAVATSNRYPLLSSADRNLQQFLDTVRRDDLACLADDGSHLGARVSLFR